MNRAVFAATAGGTFALGLVIGSFGFSPVSIEARLCEERLSEQEGLHRLEIGTLSEENVTLAAEAQRLDEEIADLEFLGAHATLLLKQGRGDPPDYDLERFLRKNPEAGIYFPYLLFAIEKHERKWPVDPMFALAILKQESDFGRHIVSKAGALGDAQFIESTARRYGLAVQEPWTWKKGRRSYRLAGEKRRAARELRNRILASVGLSFDSKAPARVKREQVRRRMANRLRELVEYYDLMADSERLDAVANDAYREYRREITKAVAHAHNVGKQARERLLREDDLARRSGVRRPRTLQEREAEVQLIINDELAQIDPRLSPMLFTEALVHHLADLFWEFKGDRRLVAARYNASRRAMEAAVAPLGGGVGIPLIYETQNYVNRVFTLQSFFAVDAGVLNNNLGIGCCSQYTGR
ncbi:transglycosylase SLT domain-containing protein [Myxococcota bacterium]